MDWITDQLAIGNAEESRDTHLLRREGFHSMLSLDGSCGESLNRQDDVKIVITLDLIDGEDNSPSDLDVAIQSLEFLASAHPPVFVHCHAGRSRSVIVVAGYLARTLGLPPSEAIELVARRRVVCIDPALEDLLFQLEWPDRSSPSVAGSDEWLGGG